MSEVIDKEVYFDQYCYKCKYCGTPEADDPCDDCLNSPSREFSHKPVKFEERKN